MFDASKVARSVEMFILDISIAILKIKHTSARFAMYKIYYMTTAVGIVSYGNLKLLEKQVNIY